LYTKISGEVSTEWPSTLCGICGKREIVEFSKINIKLHSSGRENQGMSRAIQKDVLDSGSLVEMGCASVV
jgi:hypothetical protein